jgi:hypothetical protein
VAGKGLQAAPVVATGVVGEYGRGLAREWQAQERGQAVEAALERTQELPRGVLLVGEQVDRGVHVADPRRPGGVCADERREADLSRLDRNDVAGAEQRLEEAPLALPESLRERLCPPLLVDERPQLKPGGQALLRVGRGEPTDERQVLEELVQAGERNGDVGRVGRVGRSAYRGDDALDRIRLDPMHVQDRVGGLERGRRDVSAERSAIGRDPHPAVQIALRGGRPLPLAEPRWRTGPDVRRTVDHGSKRRVMLEPVLESAVTDPGKARSLTLRAAGAEGVCRNLALDRCSSHL